jgi:hypothetical protein
MTNNQSALERGTQASQPLPRLLALHAWEIWVYAHVVKRLTRRALLRASLANATRQKFNVSNA